MSLSRLLLSYSLIVFLLVLLSGVLPLLAQEPPPTDLTALPPLSPVPPTAVATETLTVAPNDIAPSPTETATATETPLPTNTETTIPSATVTDLPILTPVHT